MPPCFDPPGATGPAGDAPIVYADEDLARLLAQVERRSYRRRRHQRRGAQIAACVGVAMVAWLSSSPAASGQVRSAHHLVALTASGVGRSAQSRA